MIKILRKKGWIVNAILKRVELNNGECPCQNNSSDRHCPCTDYRDNNLCHCNLYIKLE